ncbi:MAG TPA: hypothetical protein G4N98_00885 [Thermoflexia bacterium]|nr:hypothetical protein [Thermoflexia bacterium]
MTRLRILLMLLIPPILLFLCALMIIWLPLPQPFPPALSRGRNLMSAIVTGILGAGYIVGLALYVVATFLRAGRVLDPVLASAGMVSKSYLVFGRQYQGVLEGREVEVYFVPSSGIRPAQLNVYVAADIGMRVAMGWRRPLLDCGNCERLEAAGAELRGVQVYAQEEERAGRLLNDAASSEAIARLLADQEAYGIREIYLQPERVWLRARPQGMNGKRFRQWLDDVLVLAEASEKAFEALSE